jgi:hypothetical protein
MERWECTELKPVSFPEQNIVYVAPANWDEAKNGPCGDLPAFRDPLGLANTCCYEFDFNDIEALLNGSKLYLTIYGPQPVIGWEIR